MNTVPAKPDLRQERDRFVAFAFASADAFVELDDQQQVVYAIGAIQWFAGVTPDKLVGADFAARVSEADRPLFDAALSAGKRQGRFGPLAVSFERGGGKSVRVTIFGTCLPVQGGRSYLAMSAQRPAPPPERQALLTKDAFAAAATAALQAGAASGRTPTITMLSIEGIDALKGRMDATRADAMMADIAAHLQANSVNGAAAGRIADDKFGLVHDANLDVAGLKAVIAEKAKAADPSGAGVSVAAATVDLEAAGMSEADHAKALLYTINKFSDTHGDFTIPSLMDGYKNMLDDTRAKIANVKNVIAKSAFDVLFQPIVDLKTRQVHHYEALVRLREAGKDVSPFQFITFAEEVGIISEFDLAMVQKVVAKVKGAKAHGDSIAIAVNLSGRSIENPAFMSALQKVLRDCGDI